MLALISVGAACRSPGAAPLESGDAANGVTIDNPTDLTVKVVYEAPDGTTEPLAELAPGGHVVIDSIFAEREGLCRTGRLVALNADGRRARRAVPGLPRPDVVDRAVLVDDESIGRPQAGEAPDRRLDGPAVRTRCAVQRDTARRRMASSTRR